MLTDLKSPSKFSWLKLDLEITLLVLDQHFEYCLPALCRMGGCGILGVGPHVLKLPSLETPNIDYKNGDNK